jgi:hypothetical protein
VGEERDLDAIVEAEFLEHARNVRLDGGDPGGGPDYS